MTRLNIAIKYDPLPTEEKWYKFWMDQGFFHSEPDDREPYTVVIPPPNVTGVLHMGHMLNNTIQDILVRRARMLGKNVCWLPGTDHASIATEARVVAKLEKEGIRKTDLSREEFLKHAWEWTHKHGGIILEQLKKLGASCDWERTRFTMDTQLSESVIKVFVDLFEKGYIYRGVRMVNWDPQAKTAISDEEVNHKEEQSKLYYVRYRIEGTEDEYITIATTRPETILGDTAVCVHPEDPRYQHLQGKSVIVPMVNRVVPVIRDSYVDIEFGTGALKITPAHDENDYEIGLRHKLKVIDIFNEDGTLSQAAGLFTGVDRFEARKLAAEKLKELGALVKVEEYTNKVGYSERTDVVIEPRLSKQWFLKMDDLAEPALQHILNGDIRIYPSKFINTYRHWMENIHDWCISRQLWWGHRIPAWYLDDDTVIVAENASIALEKARSRTGNKALTLQELHQDEDVLDTWFSSWLWPISVFDGIRDPGNRDINYYYPTNDLVTAPDILFFWVARMIIAGYEYRREKPFEHVYLTGTVRDHLRRKMSKSLGNSPDPLKLIAQYGADGVRVGMLLCSPAGNDLLFDESLTEQGRNFGNKIWNAFRLVQGWQVDEKAGQSEIARIAVQWFRSRLNKVVGEIDDYFKKYRLSDALMAVYRLFWDDFSSWYLELIKPPYGEPTDAITYRQTIEFLDQLMRLLHPFMPFITEEIWHHLMPGRENKSVMVSQWPKGGDWDSSLIDRFAQMQEAVVFVRSVRAARNIPFKNKINLKIRVLKGRYDREMEPLMVKLLNLDEIMEVQDHPEGLMGQVIRTVAYYVEIHQEVNPDEEIKRITKELNYSRGFLQATLKKLQNQRFMEHAPESVVAAEKKKKVDAETRIKALEEQLKKINDHGAI